MVHHLREDCKFTGSNCSTVLSGDQPRQHLVKNNVLETSYISIITVDFDPDYGAGAVSETLVSTER
jgi:hypothetical protein